MLPNLSSNNFQINYQLQTPQRNILFLFRNTTATTKPFIHPSICPSTFQNNDSSLQTDRNRKMFANRRSRGCTRNRRVSLSRGRGGRGGCTRCTRDLWPRRSFTLVQGWPGRVAFDRLRLRPNTPNRGIACQGSQTIGRQAGRTFGSSRWLCSLLGGSQPLWRRESSAAGSAKVNSSSTVLSLGVIGEDCSKRRAPTSVCVLSILRFVPLYTRTACLRNSCRTAEVYLTGDAIMMYEGGEDSSRRFREYFHIFLCWRRWCGY